MSCTSERFLCTLDMSTGATGLSTGDPGKLVASCGDELTFPCWVRVEMFPGVTIAEQPYLIRFGQHTPQVVRPGHSNFVWAQEANVRLLNAPVNRADIRITFYERVERSGGCNG